MYAVIDLGSNSFHLLIAQFTGQGFTIVDRCSEKIQLADGLNREGTLNQAAINRGLNCLRLFKRILARHPVRETKVVATQALRQATNAQQFIQPAKTLGFDIEIISGVREAELILRGICDPLPSCTGNRLVIDIGGASTEIAVGNGDQILFAQSLPMGCVCWRDHFFSDGYEYGMRCQQAREAAREVLQPHLDALAGLEWQEVYASSGSAKMLSRISLANDWTDGKITRACVSQIQDSICHLNDHRQIELNGLKPERRDLLAPGSSIMAALMESLSIDTIHYSSTALREGILGEISGHRVGYQAQGDVRLLGT
ncbi:Ppx/GppA family phosphatase [Proteobacteria bacterium 005FR1]|nr:Ppx/GppA family phosphatase [Proteobacteria bacterium 005FR1]